MYGLAALLLFGLQLPDLPAVEKNPHTSKDDLEQGKKLYGGRCAGCHGPSGDGGKGTNLAVPRLPRAQTDRALYKIIRDGIPDTEMPRHNMTPREIWQISAYVRSLGRSDRESIRGDAARGAALAEGKGGCLQCHVMKGRGGLLGPPLDDIGLRRSAAYLRTKLVNPQADLSADFALVQLKTKRGEALTGVRLNEDTWSIQMRDMSNRLHSFWKTDLAQFTTEHRTLMPSYKGALDDREIDDLLTYLTGLRGER